MARTFAGSTHKIAVTSLSLGTLHSIQLYLDTAGGTVAIGGATGYYFPYIDATNIYYSAGVGNIAVVAHGGVSGLTQFVVTRSGFSVNIYKNGAQIGTTQTLASNTALTLATIGQQDDASFPYAGLLAEIAIWSVDITAAQVAALYRNRATEVAPNTIINHWPLIGQQSPEPDLVGSNNGTVTGATAAAHAVRIAARRPRIWRPTPPAVAASGWGHLLGLHRNRLVGVA